MTTSTQTIQKSYKQTEIGVIPADWVIKPLREISSLKGRIGWQGLKQSEFTMNPDDPFLITGMNFKDGAIRWDEVYHISSERFEIAKDIQLRPNDLLMTKDGTIGKLLFVSEIPYPQKASLNSHLLVFRPIRDSYDPKYLYYLLSSKAFRDYTELHKSGSTFFGLSQEAVSGFPVALPSKPEQTVIATALYETDTLIEKLEKLIEKKKNIKQGAMQELLTGKRRLPGFSGKWETKKLGELLDYEQPTEYLVKHADYSDDFSTPVLTAGKTFVLGYTAEETGIFQNLPTIIFDDFTTAIKYVDFPFKAKSSAMKMLIPRSKDVNLKFVFAKMQMIDFQLGDHKRHWISEYQNIEITTPKPDEQVAIASVLSDMDTEIEKLESQLTKYQNLKQGMMQTLLTGKIRLLTK